MRATAISEFGGGNLPLMDLPVPECGDNQEVFLALTIVYDRLWHCIERRAACLDHSDPPKPG